ncbi:MAG: GNAT family N-acetyltransferase [Nanoarchaeota archaeon]|nr:GNAT family N-acetyltransferase [Nanoarchaeota archaeon]MBU4299616.1 GNAT family N-acetyltransferase [Nanoarchaeota archaeon]MCG2723927.1 GNAT family N-acetyltransferase [archaeon]
MNAIKEMITGIDMITINEAEECDFAQIEAILAENHMLVPAIDGKKAMEMIKKRMGRYFLAAKENNLVLGFIRATYDGSRALIQQMAVKKTHQRKGIGKKLIFEVCKRLRKDGAPTVSVTSTEKSCPYYEKLSFKKLPITLMLAEEIDRVISITDTK